MDEMTQKNCRGAKYHPEISLIRLFSLISIITCHMMQYLEIELAWWFNVGVQIFLCISGFLYGQKDIGDVTQYYAYRLRKIYIPYLLAFIPFGIISFIFAPGIFNWSSFVLGLFCRGTLNGGGHLWFVAYILMCYLITPILGVYRNRYVKSSKSMCLYAISAFVITSLVFGLFVSYFNAAWIGCYVLGYSLGVNEKEKYIKRGVFFSIFAVVSILSNGFQIFIDYILKFSFDGRIKTIYDLFCNYAHVSLGVFLFLSMVMIFEKINFNEKMLQFLNIMDKYSYEIYLVHQFIILGPFSLMSLTNVLALNICFIVILVMLLAIILKYITISIDKVCSFIITKNHRIMKE